MKTHLKAIIGSFLLLSTLSQSSAEAKQRHKKKHAAEVSHSSSSESCSKCGLPVVAASASTDFETYGPQAFTSFGPIVFLDNLFAPIEIKHPSSGNPAHFRILKTGVYLIEWDMTLEAIGSNATGTVQLHDVTTDTTINSSQMNFFVATGTNHVLCGQTLVRLNAGTTIQLEVNVSTVTVNGLLVINPAISLSRIAE